MAIPAITNHPVGIDVLQTLLHESRHQLQYALIDRLARDGDRMVLPPGITLDQVKAWRDNASNYVSPEDDFEGYRKQPIETDARDFSTTYLDEVLDKLFPPKSRQVA